MGKKEMDILKNSLARIGESYNVVSGKIQKPGIFYGKSPEAVIFYEYYNKHQTEDDSEYNRLLITFLLSEEQKELFGVEPDIEVAVLDVFRDKHNTSKVSTLELYYLTQEGVKIFEESFGHASD